MSRRFVDLSSSRTTRCFVSLMPRVRRAIGHMARIRMRIVTNGRIHDELLGHLNAVS